MCVLTYMCDALMQRHMMSCTCIMFAPQLVPPEHDGWNLYDPLREYERVGFKEESGFRVTYANMCYELSHT